MYLSELSLDLTNRTAVVTGASRGLGKEIALALAVAGANVVCTARSEKELSQVVELIKNRGKQSIYVVADISKAQDVERLLHESVDRFGSIEILVNNAGIIISKSVFDTTEEEWKGIIDTNLTGTFLCCRMIGQHMARNNYGKIINISSNFGLIGVPLHSAYCSSKAALIEFTRCLAVEWAKYHINVNAIAPGYFDTAIPAAAFSVPKIKEAILSSIPLRRIGKTNELGGLVVYLASHASDYMTGETIVIDGGLSIR